MNAHSRGADRAAYMVAGFTIAGVYAVGMLRGRRDRLHRRGLAIPLTVAAIAAPDQILAGDIAAQEVFENEPAKFAMIEPLTTTDTQVPEVLGGVLIDGELRYGIEIPPGASLSAGSTRTPKSRAWTPSRGRASRRQAGEHRSRRVAGHGGHRDGAAGTVSLVRLAVVATPPAAQPGAGQPLVPALRGGQRRAGDHRHGSRLGRNGGRPAAVDRRRIPADRGSRDDHWNVWLFYGATVVLYAALAVGTFFVLRLLRLLRRRWREGDDHATEGRAGGEGDVPYGPSRARSDASA